MSEPPDDEVMAAAVLVKSDRGDDWVKCMGVGASEAIPVHGQLEIVVVLFPWPLAQRLAVTETRLGLAVKLDGIPVRHYASLVEKEESGLVVSAKFSETPVTRGQTIQVQISTVAELTRLCPCEECAKERQQWN